MATNFPGSLDAFTNPIASDTLDNPPHDEQHADINDAMEAVQAKLGVGAHTIGEWTAYTPTTYGLTLGDGTLDFQYARVNDLIVVIGTFTLGSTSAVTGEIMFSMPVDTSLTNVGSGMANESGVGIKNIVPFVDTSYNPARIRCFTMQTNVTYGILVATSSSIPITTWSANDTVRVTIVTRVA